MNPIMLKLVLHDRERIALIKKINEVFDSKETFDFKSLSWSQIHSDFKDARINRHLGNKQITLTGDYFKDFDSIVNYKISNIANEIDSSASVKYINLTIISNEYGTPALPPHVDYQQGIGFLIDVQVDSNFMWTKIVDDTVNVLDNGDILIFDPEDSVHWREPKILNDGQFILMLCVYFESQKEKTVSIIDRSKRYKDAVDRYREQQKYILSVKDKINWNDVSVGG